MRRATLVATAACLLIGAVSSEPLSLESYLNLTLDLVRQGVKGWGEIVEVLESGEATADEVEAMKSEMLAAEKETLQRYGVSKEGLALFVQEHEREILDGLEADRSVNEELTTLALELNRLMAEFLRLKAPAAAVEQDSSDGG